MSGRRSTRASKKVKREEEERKSGDDEEDQVEDSEEQEEEDQEEDGSILGKRTRGKRAAEDDHAAVEAAAAEALQGLLDKLKLKKPTGKKPVPTPTNPRASFLEMHMQIAIASAARSEEEDTKVGCAVTDSKLVLSGIGYNAFHSKQGPIELPAKDSKKQGPTQAEKLLQEANQPSYTVSHVLPYGTVVLEVRECLERELLFDYRHHFSIHAEMNAILHCNVPLQSHRGGWIFVTLIPCPACFKHIVQTGIKNVVYLDDNFKYPDTWTQASRHGISLIPYKVFEISSDQIAKCFLPRHNKLASTMSGKLKNAKPVIFQSQPPTAIIKSIIRERTNIPLPNKAMYIKAMVLFCHKHEENSKTVQDLENELKIKQ